MPDIGVRVTQRATERNPAPAASGVPYVVGAAPVHAAENPAKPGVPVLCSSWKEAVAKLGYSEDWEKYPLCEFMFSHFKLYQCQPVVFCNVLDVSTMKKPATAETVTLAGHRALLPYEALAEGLTVKNGEAALAEGEDYAAFYDQDLGALVVELLPGSPAYGAAELSVESGQADPGAVTKLDIVKGIAAVDACISTARIAPDLLCAPGWSQDPAVAAVLTEKAGKINGLLPAKALIDADCTGAGVTQYGQLPDYKAKNSLTDEDQILCWPLVVKDGRTYHMSTHLAGLMAQVDTANGGCPFESPSNKALEIDGCCLADGTEISLTFDQVNLVAGHYGVVTAFHFLTNGWVAKGNYTACFPGSEDPKDHFIPTSRMFGWVARFLIFNFWGRLDQPMRRRLVDDVVDATNIWLNGQVGAEHLLGARVSYEAEENPLTDLLQGIIKFHIYMTPPGVAQEILFTLEYDIDYVAAALAG